MSKRGSFFKSPLRALRSKEGLAALEFALIAPVMLVLLFGMVESVEALGTNRRVENVAASLADVVARDTIVDSDDISDLWGAIGPLMFPEPSGQLKVRVTSVLIQSATQAKVGWSKGHNGMAGLATGANFSLPSAMMIPGTSVIVTEVNYLYTPTLSMVLGGSLQMNHTEYRRPRVVDPITFQP